MMNRSSLSILTDVVIDDVHHSEFVALNKMQIESVVQID